MENQKDELRKMSNEYLHSLWKVVQAGGLEFLPHDRQRLGRIMMEHEQYHNQFEIADLIHNHPYDTDSEVNPFLHIALHGIIEAQLESKEPIEVFQFYNAMKTNKVSKHDTIHLIAMIFSPLLLDTMKREVSFDDKKYRSLLRRYKDKKPHKIKSSLEREFG